MAATETESKVRHEGFCVSSKPRVESYRHLSDDPVTGRSKATHAVDRCMDCGAASYTPLG